MDNTYIKLFRSLKNWRWFAVNGMLNIWIYLLLNARYEDGYVYGVFVKRGQVITGRKKLSKETGLSERTVRTCLERLKSTNEVTTETTNQYTIITIIKWEDYQGGEEIETKQSTKQSTIKRPATDQRPTTKEERKKEKKEKNNKDIGIFEITLNDFIEMRKAIKKPLTDKALVLLKNKLNGITTNEEEQIKILEQSILNNWQSVFPLKTDLPKKSFNTTNQRETEADQLAKQRELVERLTNGSY